MIETWQQMKDRHEREKFNAVQSLNEQGLTQTETAQALGIKLSHLTTFASRRGIKWIVVSMGKPSRRRVPTLPPADPKSFEVQVCRSFIAKRPGISVDSLTSQLAARGFTSAHIQAAIGGQ